MKEFCINLKEHVTKIISYEKNITPLANYEK